MTTRFLATGFYADPSMPHGHVRVERNGMRLVMTLQTFQTVHAVHAGPEVFPELRQRPDGTYPIPRSLLEKDHADEVRRGLAEVGSPSQAQSGYCLYPPCVLPAETVRDGFPLCAFHDEVLRGWDELTA